MTLQNDLVELGYLACREFYVIGFIHLADLPRHLDAACFINAQIGGICPGF